MPILSGCCFCFDLKVGTKIIGVLSLIGSLVNSLMFAILLVMLVLMDIGADIAKNLHNNNPPPSNVDDDYADIREEGKQLFELFQEHVGIVKVMLYILLALSLLMIITSSMLIHGVRRNRRGLLVPFIVQEVLVIIVMLSFGIGMFVVFGTHKAIVSSALSTIVGSVISIYFLLVVISQYQALGLIRMHEEISMNK